MRIKDIIDLVNRLKDQIRYLNAQILVNLREGEDNTQLINQVSTLEAELDNLLYGNYELEDNKELISKMDYIKDNLL